MQDRKETWQWIEKTLLSGPSGGMLYLSKPRQKVRAGHAWHWPEAVADRPGELEALRQRLARLSGAWVLRYVKEGDRLDAAVLWQWPAEEGLFAAQQAEEQASDPVGYTALVDPFATDPPLTGEPPAAEQPAPETSLVPAQAEQDADIDCAPVSLFECSWPGVGSFTLNREQRTVFNLLARRYLQTDTPEIEEEELLITAGVEARSLDELFVNIKTWRSLVVRDQRKKTVRIRPLPMGELPGEFE